MIDIISIDDERWDDIVQSFPNYDVYYLSGYVKPFQVNGDGLPLLFYYQNDDVRGICVLMKRIIPTTSYFDLITPYGYGGFIFDGVQIDLVSFFKEYEQLLVDNRIVSVFYRFHPQLDNAKYVRKFCHITDLGHTVEMDVSSGNIIWDNLTSKNRNMIRKAIKAGVTIEHSKSLSLLSEFRIIYNGTMKKDNAGAYYYFPTEFYSQLHAGLNNNYELFYAKLNDTIISTAIILYANGRMHYHLSGSLFEYRNIAPSNLLLYEAALWGNSIGCKSFHMGGGIGSGEDNLYKFKSAFNRNCSGLQFSIGKHIVLQDVYEQLVQSRIQNDANFNTEINYFPLYRS